MAIYGLSRQLITLAVEVSSITDSTGVKTQASPLRKMENTLNSYTSSPSPDFDNNVMVSAYLNLIARKPMSYCAVNHKCLGLRFALESVQLALKVNQTALTKPIYCFQFTDRLINAGSVLI